MIQLWTISNLLRLPYAIRKKCVFYAPLTDSLDFYGIDPVDYFRSGSTTRTGRDGLSHTVAANVPVFNYSGENALGLSTAGSPTIRFAAANVLNNANTLVWYEDRVPKSTPTNANPFDMTGTWAGVAGINASHIFKANAILSNAEINAIQDALLGITQIIPEPPPPPTAETGSFIDETPSGARNGINKVFTLSQTPDVGSLEIFWGGIYIKRVPSAPSNMEYTLGGTGNKTVTMGSAPEATNDLTAHYCTVAP